MSIIYEALKKVEGQKEVLAPETIPEDIILPGERAEKEVKREKRVYFLPAALLLVALGISALPFILPRQKQAQKPRSQILDQVTLREEPAQEYILEGIIYDSESAFALINGKVVNELDVLGNFRIDKISEDMVGMTNVNDNTTITLSLSD